MSSPLLFITLLFCSTVLALKDKIIYGNDDRVEALEWLEGNDTIKSLLVQADVALFFGGSISDPTGSPTILNRDFLTRGFIASNGSTCPLCSSERFRGQPSDAFCSGVLFRDRHTVLTAGHCIGLLGGRRTVRNAPCTSNGQTTIYLVFDYRMGPGNTIPSLQIARANLFGCSRIEYAILDNSNDFALLRLDRDVPSSRTPLQSECADLQVGTNLLIAGHPLGLPQKVSEDSSILAISRNYFSTNVDSYAGNSGSALVNAETGKVVGVLIAGQPDFAWNKIDSCCTSAICPQTGCPFSGGGRVAEIGYDVASVTCAGKKMDVFF